MFAGSPERSGVPCHTMAKIVVAGGGMCGLAAAQVLADDGHEVTVVERDPAPPPPDVDTAFSGWERRSVAQFGLAHWLHARGTRILRDDVPRAYQLLTEHGGYHYNLVRYVLGVQGITEHDAIDDRYENVTGRRSTLEWAMATAAGEHPGVTVRRGIGVEALLTGTPLAEGVPHVTGVQLEGGEELSADLVIDASGRRSPTLDWLAAIGARPPVEDAEDSGFAYYGRYYASSDGSVPPLMGPALAPYGSFSVLTLGADNGTWSVTVYGLSDDKHLRRARDPEAYERVVRACPLQAHWLDGEPISEMRSMAGVVDRHRRFVVDGVPCATGILSVADASSCTNPSLGRGISFGLMHVQMLRAAVAEHLGDPYELALAFDEVTERDMRPWHDATTTIDRRRVGEMRVFREGGVPEPTPEQQIADTLLAAVTVDPTAARAFGDIFACLALPSEVFARPGMFEHVLQLGETVTPQPLPGPDRSELEALLA